MRIGVHASNSSRYGGQFQFLETVLEALAEDGAGHEYRLFYFEDGGNLAARYRRPDWRWVALPRRSGERLGPRLGPAVAAWAGRAARHMGFNLLPVQRPAQEPGPGDDRIARFLAPHALDLILFPTWTDQCWSWGVPYVFVPHDLQHRMQPEFPEVSMLGGWQRREAMFSHALPRARRVLADSEAGRAFIADYYGVPTERIGLLPYTVPPGLRAAPRGAAALERLALPRRYLLYPAQFWPHKNHYRVIEAAAMLERKAGLQIHLVFAGGEPEAWSAWPVCRALAERCGMAARVHRVGYVDDATLAALYAGAAGLVMPTFFGPTNIPYLEAFYFGCPVIASDLPGIREQVGDAALRVDPRSTPDIARAMKYLWTDAALGKRLAEAGARRLAELGPAAFRRNLLAAIGAALNA